MFKAICRTVFLLFVLALALPAAAQEAKPEKSGGLGLGLESSDKPITIISNRLEADDKAMTVTFSGEVKAVQGDATLWCDKMIVSYAKGRPKPGQKPEDADREIQKIHSIGHVKVVQKDKTAWGQQGIFEVQANRVTLLGDPRIQQGPNVITGDKIIVYLNEDRAVVEGGKRRVTAVIVPQTMESGPKEKSTGAEKPKPAPRPSGRTGTRTSGSQGTTGQTGLKSRTQVD